MKISGQALVVALIFISIMVSTITALSAMRIMKRQAQHEQALVNDLHGLRLALIKRWWERDAHLPVMQWWQGSEIQDLIAVFPYSDIAFSLRPSPLALTTSFHHEDIAERVHEQLAQTSQEGVDVYLHFPQQLAQLSSALLRTGVHEDAPVQASFEFSDHDIKHVERAQIGELDAQEGDIANLLTTHLEASVFNTDTLSSGTIQGEELRNEQLSVNQITSTQTEFGVSNASQGVASEQVTSNKLEVMQLFARSTSHEQVEAGQVFVDSAVSLQGISGERLLELNEALVGLRNEIDHCIHVSLWCRPVEKPKLAFIECHQCEVTQTQNNFTATLTWSVRSCTHGCSLLLSSDQGTQLSCNKNRFLPREHGELICSVTGKFIDAGLYTPQVHVTLINEKADYLRVTGTRELSWEKEAIATACEDFSTSLQVMGSVPLLTIPFYVSVPATDRTYSRTVNGDNCRYSELPTYYMCSYTQYCDSQGSWQPPSTSCICYESGG